MLFYLLLVRVAPSAAESLTPSPQQGLAPVGWAGDPPHHVPPLSPSLPTGNSHGTLSPPLSQDVGVHFSLLLNSFSTSIDSGSEGPRLYNQATWFQSLAV